MKNILGIDLGTNSLGWALIAANESLLDGGVIIFPRGNNEDPKTGKESSYSQMRTAYRSARRRLYRRKLRRQRILDLALKHFGIIQEDIYSNTSPIELYKLRANGLSRKLIPSELFRICLYFAKKRGFRSNRKELMRDSAKDLGTVNQGIHELEQAILESHSATLGVYYYQLISDHFAGKRLNERILERWTSRKMYQDELEAILKHQLSYNETPYTTELAEDIQREVFYQRLLKSAKNLVGKCRLEPNKRCMPRSHPVFQEFRIWQNLNNLIWANPDTAEMDGLTIEQKTKLFQFLHTEAKPTEAKIKKLLGLSNRVIFNDIELKPATTAIQMGQALQDSTLTNMTESERDRIYHCLLYTADDSLSKLKNYLYNKFKLIPETVDKLWNIKLEQDYSNISHKAAKKLIPFMKMGMRYDQACTEAGYHHSYDNKFKDLPNVRSLKTNELRNPVVQKAVSTCILLVNKIIEKYGKPDEVRIELARELKKPKKVREQMRNSNLNKQRKRELYRQILEKHFERTIAYSDSVLAKYELWLELGCQADDLHDFDAFTREVKKSDLEKYHLWLEADRLSPYTGKVISLSQLLSPHIEIEHILPFSRSLDNSFANKTLCERQLNASKLNMTPLEYFQNRPHSELEQFKKRIATFSNPFKRAMFLSEFLPDNFLNSQLSDTAYIARQSIDRLSECIEKVYATKGGVTHMIRKALGLNSILHYEGTPDQIADMKNRGDHRHHFIDAAVIASTNQSIIQAISKSKARGDGNMNIEIQMPWNSFRTDLEDMANGLLIVHRFPKKLTRRSINTYKHNKKETKVQLIQKAIRGPMHEDTLYGKITNPYTGELNYVVRKDIRSLDEKQIEKIVDKGIKAFLKNEIEKQGSWAQVIKNPINFNGKPLRRVRVLNASKELPLLRAETKTYIEPGNNYILAIYQADNGKRDYITLTFYEALRNKLEKGKLYPSELKDKKLLYTLTHYDKFILYKEHPEEINWSNKEELNERLYHVIKFSGNSIYLGKSILSKIQADKDMMPIKLKCGSNTIKAIKVKLNTLGEIYWRSDIGFVNQA